jgi:bacterioferritin-associated ferredoxin
MNVLLRLPEGTSRSLLRCWLTFKDVVQLDTAFCSSLSRPAYHSLASSTQVRYTAFESNIERRDCSVAYLDWVLKRRLHLAYLSPPAKLEAMPSLRKAFFQFAGQAILRMHVHGPLSNVLSTAAEYCTRVESLRVSECIYGDAEEFSILNCLAVEQSLLEFLQANGRCMRKLVLSLCRAFGEDTFVAAAQRCPNLRHLDLHGTAVTDASLAHIARRTSQLELLDVGCTEVSDTGMCYVVRHWPELQELFVADLPLTDRFVTALATHCTLLRILTIETNHSITDTSLLALSATCKQLEELCVPVCSGITDNGIVALAKGCRRLRKLMLGGMPRVTDTALAALAQHSAQLNVLWVCCCSEVTNAGVLAVVEHCLQLTAVTISGCWRVTSDVMWAFRSEVRVRYRDTYDVRLPDSEDGDDLHHHSHAGIWGTAAPQTVTDSDSSEHLHELLAGAEI